MCGIAAVLSSRPDQPVNREILERMVDSITHRGPDDRGLHLISAGGIGMRRLSIIDVSGGHQPITGEDGSVTVVCNGEIYNHLELRAQLEAKGHKFKTHSDVEVIVHLYEEEGPDFIGKLRGMYGIALWDEKRQRLFAARDRVGIKPLFYAEAQGCLLLGSEIKAILQSGKIERSMDLQALDEYFTFGYIPAPRTIFQGIRKLEPGHAMTFEKGQLRIWKYWDLSFAKKSRWDENEAGERFLHLFKNTVKNHLMSDVPLGAFLSGGVDSSLIVALMSEFTSGPVKTFTMGFGGQKGGYLDERSFARSVSARYGTDHTEFQVEPDLRSVLDPIAAAFDEPFADDSVIPSYYICKLAGQKVKVALTGLGGDELFGGYERYLGLKLSEAYGRLPSLIRNGLVSPIVNHLPELKSGHYTINHMKRFVRASSLAPHDRYASYVSVYDRKAKQSLFSADLVSRIAQSSDAKDPFGPFRSSDAGNLLERAIDQDFKTYLPEDILALSDRLSMQHALELRVPFVDHELVEFCAGLPENLKIRFLEKKYLLRKVSRRFLPEEILTHRKQGFASPMAAWLRGDLKGYIREHLSESALAQHGLFNPEAVRRLLDDHESRRELNDKKLFTLLMFQKWHENYMGKR